MARKRNVPNPLDPDDPRVAQVYKDRYGQQIRVDDLVIYGGYRGTVHVGRVVSINLLRQDYKPFSHNRATMTLHDLDESLRPKYNVRRTWDPVTQGLTDEIEQVPVTFTLRDPQTTCVRWR